MRLTFVIKSGDECRILLVTRECGSLRLELIKVNTKD